MQFQKTPRQILWEKGFERLVKSVDNFVNGLYGVPEECYFGRSRVYGEIAPIDITSMMILGERMKERWIDYLYEDVIKNEWDGRVNYKFKLIFCLTCRNQN